MAEGPVLAAIVDIPSLFRRAEPWQETTSAACWTACWAAGAGAGVPAGAGNILGALLGALGADKGGAGDDNAREA
ncbi:hypothetical protein ACFU6I_02870 [Streptomyces sp. NPDC057486]|uniref:hypothetical protein n=1 Tax=Streptomyces sp. NPDC057486 TaxID=3346145 RepID=UPI00367F03A9